MKHIERFFRRLSYLGTTWTVDGPTPSFTGLRARILHFAIAFGWMSKGGPYDHRTFLQRTLANRNARSHLRFALTGHFHGRSAS